MSVATRNVEVSEGKALETWPYEALVSSIERGTLSDWLPIIDEIYREPRGPVARQVGAYLEYASPYGVGPLLRRAIRHAREAEEARDRASVAAEIRDLIAQSGLSLAELAAKLGTSRSRLSTYRSGKVVPAATFMLKLRREAARDASEGSE